MEKSTLIPWDFWPKYKLVAHPPAEALNMLEQARSDFKKLQPGEGHYPDLEISFFNHRLPESSEKLLQTWMQNLCTTQHAFSVLLNNISGIPPHLVFARIQPTPQHMVFDQKLISLLSQLSGVASANLKLTQQSRLKLITDLPGMKFHYAMQFFSGIDLSMEITIHQFELMKLNNSGHWQLLQRFHLAKNEHTQYQPWFQPQS
jgi:hypothetical protein